MISKSLKNLLPVVSLSIGIYGIVLLVLSSQLDSLEFTRPHKALALLEPLETQDKKIEKSTSTNPPKTTPSNPLFETIEMRVKKVEEFCKAKNNQVGKIGNLLVLKERNLVWCPVYKSGTSAWMTYLVHLSNKSPKEKEQLIAKHVGIGNTYY